MSNPFEDKGPNFENEARKTVDSSWDSPFHTLGKGSTQAAPGNHKHPDLQDAIDNAEAAAKAYADTQDAAHVAAADPHPQYADDTEITDLFDVLEAMGDWTENYSGATQHFLQTIPNPGVNASLSPSFATSYTNPLNRRAVVELRAFGFFYLAPSGGTSYLQIKEEDSPNVTRLTYRHYREEVPPGETGGFAYNSFDCFNLVIVEPNATITFELIGRTTAGSNDTLIQYATLGARMVGLAA